MNKKYMNSSFILASKSPIRKKILSDLGYSFTCVPSNTPEFFNEESVEKNAMRLALEKAIAIQKKYPNKIIIGSDSIMVDPSGMFLEKPKDRNDALQMMKNRSGKKESIVSGLAILYKKNIFTSYEKTFMTWGKISKHKINFILDKNEWQGKCGGVMVEGTTGLFIEKIEGSLVNIMGFALNEFEEGMKNIVNNK